MSSLLSSLFGFSALTMLSTAVNLVKFNLSFTYPLFRSARIARGKEPDEHKIKLLKFWVIYALVELIVYYTYSILEILDVTDIALMCIYFILIVNNFQGAEYTYNTLITEFFGRNEQQLHDFFKWLRKIFENSVFQVFDAGREMFYALMAGVLPRLPAPIRIPLAYMGIEEFLNKSLEKYKNFETKKKKDDEYKRRLTEIEHNRPISPNIKDKKISFSLKQDDKPKTGGKIDLSGKKDTGAAPKQTAEKQRRIYDPSTKQFKYVSIGESKDGAGGKKPSTAPQTESKGSSGAPAPAASKTGDRDGMPKTIPFDQDDDDYSDDGRNQSVRKESPSVKQRKTGAGATKPLNK